MALVRALMIFAVLWAVLAVAVNLVLHLSRRDKLALGRLLAVSAVGALLATGVLWATVALF